MENRIVFSEGSVGDLVKAHAGFLGDIADVGKGSKGYGYTYADLASILAECRPALSAWGLSLTQFPTFSMYPPEMRLTMPADSKGFAPEVIGEVVIVTTLAHESGQWMRGELSIPVETMKNLSVAQAVGAAISYARRYHASSILAIAQEDNDAARPREESPQGRQQPRQQRPAARQPRVELAEPGTIQGLKERIQRMGRNADQFAKAVAGVQSLDQLPASAVEAAQKMLAKAEALHYQEKKEAEAAQASEENADQTPAAGPDEGDQHSADAA